MVEFRDVRFLSVSQLFQGVYFNISDTASHMSGCLPVFAVNLTRTQKEVVSTPIYHCL